MRVQYNATASTEHAYTQALNNDLGIYHMQTGAGIGSFLAKLLRKAIPIGKTILHHGYELIKPELKKAAVKGIEYVAKQGYQYADKAQDAAYKKIGAKRARTKDATSMKIGAKRPRTKEDAFTRNPL